MDGRLQQATGDGRRQTNKASMQQIIPGVPGKTTIWYNDFGQHPRVTCTCNMQHAHLYSLANGVYGIICAIHQPFSQTQKGISGSYKAVQHNECTSRALRRQNSQACQTKPLRIINSNSMLKSSRGAPSLPQILRTSPAGQD